MEWGVWFYVSRKSNHGDDGDESEELRAIFSTSTFFCQQLHDAAWQFASAAAAMLQQARLSLTGLRSWILLGEP